MNNIDKIAIQAVKNYIVNHNAKECLCLPEVPLDMVQKNSVGTLTDFLFTSPITPHQKYEIIFYTESNSYILQTYELMEKQFFEYKNIEKK